MTQDELVRRLAEDANLYLYQARNALDKMSKIIEEELRAGNAVRLNHLGTFTAQTYAPRVGRDPRTNEALTIPARKKLVFKPKKALWNLEKMEDTEKRDAV